MRGYSFPFIFSDIFEYLLLPPRSSLEAVSPRLTPKAGHDHNARGGGGGGGV